jgi:hypothetical protein
MEGHFPFMKVSVEKQPNCIATLHAIVPADLVQKKTEKLASLSLLCDLLPLKN